MKKEQNSTAVEVHPTKTVKSTTKESKEISSTTVKPIESNHHIGNIHVLLSLPNSHCSSPYLENRPVASSTKKTVSDVPAPILPIQESNPPMSTVDVDNDYIEPESPTGIDALIYDEEDNEDDVNSSSRSSTTRSPTENVEDILPYQPIVREDYNPLKAQIESIPM